MIPRMSGSSSFRARFEGMVARLREHPQVEIFACVVRPPASEAALREIVDSFGYPIPPALARFYSEHDGVFLEWGLRGREYSSRTAPFSYPDYGQPPGCINLLPAREAMSTAWEADYHVNEISEEQHKRLFGGTPEPEPPVGSVCVDNFSKYNHADLILGPEPVMIVSTDHGADMEASDWASVELYLDMTLALYGLNRYSRGLGIGWSRKPQRRAEWSARPSLDEIIAWAEEDSE